MLGRDKLMRPSIILKISLIRSCIRGDRLSRLTLYTIPELINILKTNVRGGSMGEEKNLVRLQDEDWDLLLPGKEFTLGKTVLMIEPLGLKATGILLKRLSELVELWGPVLDEYSSGAFGLKEPKDKMATVLPKMAEMIELHAVDLITLLSKVAEEDIKRLPPAKAIELCIFCITVNVESQEGLEKNFITLAAQITQMVQNRDLPGASGKQSKH